MIKNLTLITMCSALAALNIACDRSAGLSPKDDERLTRLRLGEAEIVSKSDLFQLRRDADLGRAVGRYQQYSRGNRTFRLDTATGSTCVLLATPADWKKPEMAAQSCAQEGPPLVQQYEALRAEFIELARSSVGQSDYLRSHLDVFRQMYQTEYADLSDTSVAEALTAKAAALRIRLVVLESESNARQP